MKRFSIKTLLVLVAIAAIAIWWTDSGYRVIYDEVSPSHGQILIFAKREWRSDLYELRIRYTSNNAQPDEIHISDTILLEDFGDKKLEFKSLIDDESGLWCLYDTSGQDVVILVLPAKGRNQKFGQIWHPGIHIGWARGLWIDYFRTIKESHPEIPYDELPSVLRTMVD